MNTNYAIYNIFGLTDAMILEAVAAASKVIEPDDIKEMWLYPQTSSIYVLVGTFPCVRVPHDFGAGAVTCQ